MQLQTARAHDTGIEIAALSADTHEGDKQAATASV